MAKVKSLLQHTKTRLGMEKIDPTMLAKRDKKPFGLRSPPPPKKKNGNGKQLACRRGRPALEEHAG